MVRTLGDSMRQKKAAVSEQKTKEAYQTLEWEREEMRRTLIRQKLECEMAVQQWKEVGSELTCLSI